MLGCLSELYVRIDPKIGGAGIMKLVRKVQRELESGSGVFNRGDLPTVLQYEAIRGEFYRLIGSSRTTPLRNAAEPCNVTKESVSRGAMKPFNTGDEQEESPRRRRKQWQKYDPDAMKTQDLKRPATSPASIFEFVHEDKSRKAIERDLWAQTHVMDYLPVASSECLKAETVGMLKGLEKSMNFLSKEKRRVCC